jgi:hypothetical protein
VTVVDQVIDIQWKSGEDEHAEGPDLEARWEEITGDEIIGTVQHAVYRAPNRRLDKLTVRGCYGEPRDEHAARVVREQQADRERQQRDYDAVIAARDWTYNGYNPSHL